MSAVVAYLQALLSGPVVVAAVAGLVAGCLAGGLAAGGNGWRRARDARPSPAAQVPPDGGQPPVAPAAVGEELRLARLELVTLREESASRNERLTRLKADLRCELARSARLRQELAARVDEAVRSQARLRHLESEVRIARAGTEEILEQVTRLEQERDDLNTLVRTLREELVVQARSLPANPSGRDPVLGA